MKNNVLLLLFLFITLNGISSENRDILQKEASEIEIEKNLVKEFSEIGFPAYNDRDFWEKLPDNLKDQYIKSAEGKLNYNWPVVKATDYLEIIRSGDRRQSVYAAPRSALMALVMGELIEGKGRFLDQIINGVWYYSEQTWWG
jgi:hypothetical protein